MVIADDGDILSIDTKKESKEWGIYEIIMLIGNCDYDTNGDNTKKIKKMGRGYDHRIVISRINILIIIIL